MSLDTSAEVWTSEAGTNTTSPSLYEASPGIIVLLAFAYGLISLLALVGNGLVVIIITGNKRMQSVTNFLLANLASADILIAVAAVPFQFQAALLQRWVLPNFMCIVAPFVQVLSVNVSIFTLTVISIERYRALLYPFKSRISKRSAGYAIAVIWVCAVLCASPMAATLRVQNLDDPTVHGGKRAFCCPSGLSTPFNDSTVAHDIWLAESKRIFGGYVVFLVVIQFLAPLLIIGFAYLNIAVHLWGSHMPGVAASQGHIELSASRTKQRQKVIKMLIMVVALFAFCWFPLQAYNFLTVAAPSIDSYPYINIVWFCCNFLAMSNSCQNPFILGLCNEKFRLELREKISLTCRVCGEKSEPVQHLSDYSGAPPRHDETDLLATVGQTTTITQPSSYYHRIRRQAGKRYAQQDTGLPPNDSPVHLKANSVASNNGGNGHLTVKIRYGIS